MGGQLVGLQSLRTLLQMLWKSDTWALWRVEKFGPVPTLSRQAPAPRQHLYPPTHVLKRDFKGWMLGATGMAEVVEVVKAPPSSPWRHTPGHLQEHPFPSV